ncbi:MAG: penicillin-binding protein 2 [Bacteroidetes bacterium RIFCSPLOWO2_12_FULL_35_15]|nr:MAG: penicillin-binding protein 2 [Bacteroidetes bacterium RIFCSPLOWO2_12_FULL_35_15]
MNQLSERKYIIIGVFILVGLIYISRLFYIQVLDDSYKLDAQNQAFRYTTEFPIRGYIYDRNNKLLVYNEAAYDLMVLPKNVKNIDTMDLCSLLGITKEQFLKKMKKATQSPNSPRKESIFEKQLSPKDYASLQERLYSFPGFWVQSRTLRKYPKKIAAHMLGYIGEADKRITEKNPYYKEGDYLGISGIEKTYEKVLRGKKGMHIIMKDVNNRDMGSYMNGLYDTAAISGLPLTTTIDADLQEYAEQLMQNKIGSVVAIDPSTGEILAIVTSPTYDPNLFVGRARNKNFVELSLDSIGKPLFNRSTMASYPPGSTFKLIMALIGLNEGVLTPETRYPCARGYPPLGGRPKCHAHPSPQNLEGAIGTSCNSYFSFVFKSVIDDKKYHDTYKAYANWRDIATSFCLGTKTGSDLAHELRGNVPSINYYDKVFGKGSWKASTVISLGIGQAEMGITPLQNANLVAIIANKGWYYTPHIVKAINNNANDTILDRFKVKHYTKIKDTAIYNMVIAGMAKAVEGGTASALKIEGIPYCAKTGTAQNPHGKDHSVFVCFAPKDNPKIAIGILIENAGFGSTYAGPIARLMMEKYLKGKITRPDLEKRMLETDLIHKGKNEVKK